MYEVFITFVFLVVPGQYPLATPIRTYEECERLREPYLKRNQTARCVQVRRIAVIDPESKEMIIELKKVQ